MNKEKEAYQRNLETEKLVSGGLDNLLYQIKKTDKMIKKKMEEAKPEEKSRMEMIFSKNMDLKNLIKKGSIKDLHEFSKKILDRNGS